MAHWGRNRLIGAGLGTLVAALGLVVLFSWHLNVPFVLQLNPSWVPMQYNTALSFLAVGLALLFLAAGRFRVAAAIGALPLLIGAVTLLTWVLDLHPGVDELLLRHYITVLTPSPGRMSPNTAVGFVLSGSALLLTAAEKYAARPVQVWILGLLMMVCGTAAGVWTLIQGGSAGAEPVRFTYMAIHTAAGFVLAGAALVVLTASARAGLAESERQSALPTAAGLIVAMASFVLWQVLTVAEYARVRSGMRGALAQLVADIESASNNWNEAFIARSRRASQEEAGMPPGYWEEKARDHFLGNSWIREIIWFNADGSLRHRIVRDPAEQLPDAALLVRPVPNEDFRRALTAGEIRIFRPPAGSSSGWEQMACILIPTETEGAPGLIVYLVRLDRMFSAGIGETAGGYDALIKDAGQPIFRRIDISPSQRDYGVEEQAIDAYWHRWQMEVRPGPDIVARLTTPLPLLTLLLGLASSVLMTAALRYAGMARQRRAGMVRAQALLEGEVEERRRAELAAYSSEERARQALAQIQHILDQSKDLICTMDSAGYFRLVSASSWEILGYKPEEMVGRHWNEFVVPEDEERTEVQTAALLAGADAGVLDNRLRRRDGTLVYLSWAATWRPHLQRSYAIGRDVTLRNRQEALREGQRAVLHSIVAGAPLRKVLEEICGFIERIDPGVYSSIVLLDEEGTRVETAIAPRLAPELLATLDGLPIGPAAGSCGTAMWRAERVIVTDVETDPLWKDYLVFTRAQGLRACWSVPIMGTDSRVLGSFAIYYSTPRSPEDHELEMIEAAAALAAVAIEREHAQSRLLESREQLEFARRLAQLNYWEVHLDSGRIMLSAEMLDMLELDPEAEYQFDVLGQYVLEPDREVVLASREAAINHDTPIDVEYRLRLPDGSIAYIHARGRAFRRQDGVVTKLAGTVQDITARKKVELENARLYAELERRVEHRTRELELSNRELEAFSYSVSHDLRAPLRAIAGFSALLKEQYGGGLDAQAQHYLDRIVAGTVRMSTLIDDLLELGRVNQVELVRQPLDISALATNVCGRFQERWPERSVEVEIQPGMVAWGDPRLIEVVFENLLGNAWKFTADRAEAKVTVGRKRQGGEDVFFVADNGVGFDPQYATNLFGVFQRLHAASAFPGTGVGLATVQRILQRHGGRIWADAVLNEGATFSFTMAEKPQ